MQNTVAYQKVENLLLSPKAKLYLKVETENYGVTFI